MPMNIPLQARYLYKHPWTPELDFLFASIVVRVTDGMSWPIHSYPSEFKRGVFDEMNAKSRKHFTQRLWLYKAWYYTFKEVVTNKRVQWVPAKNFVRVTDEVWTLLMEQNPCAGAYYYCVDPLFNEFSIMFEMHDVKVEPPADVIQLSSDGEAQDEDEDEDEDKAEDEDEEEEEDGDSDEDEDEDEDKADEDEVNSPAPMKDNKTRQKLFDDHGALSDRLSTTKHPAHENNQPSKIYPMNPPRPTPYSPSGSSCASSSPCWMVPRAPK